MPADALLDEFIKPNRKLGRSHAVPLLPPEVLMRMKYEVIGNFDSADFKLTHHRRFKGLDTPRIIKEELSSAQRRVPRDRTWSLPQVGTEKMHRHQHLRPTWVRAAAGPGPRIPKRLVPSRLRRCHIPKQIDCISRFKSKSFLENILGSNAGGRGVPRESALRTQPFRSQPDNAKVTPHR